MSVAYLVAPHPLVYLHVHTYNVMIISQSLWGGGGGGRLPLVDEFKPFCPL